MNGDNLITFLSNLTIKFDVICLTETYIQDESLYHSFLDGYDGFHSMRPNGRLGGGVSIFINQRLINYSLISDLTINCSIAETIFIKVSLERKNFFIGCCYRPPDSNKNDFLEFCDENFSNLSANCRDIILCGDFIYA